MSHKKTEKLGSDLQVESQCPSVRSAISYLNHYSFQGDVKRVNKIGSINGTWGPFFRISFDLIIHSYVKGKGKQGWSSVLAFDKKPSITLNKNGELKFFFQKRKYNFIINVVLNKWYEISIEQKPNNQKVRKKSLYNTIFSVSLSVRLLSPPPSLNRLRYRENACLL